MNITKLISLALLTSCVLAGCYEKQGPLERAGERADEIGDNVKKGKPILHKPGTLEKAGEAVDDTFKGER